MTKLSYPVRRYGNDHDRYDWSYSARREPVHLGDNKRAGAFLVVPLEFFPLTPSGKPFKHPGAMVTPYPDLRHFTTRDYGLRVGVYRILKALAAEDIKAVFPVNSVLLDRCAPLIKDILADGHEIAAHGISTDHIHFDGLSEAEEAAWIRQVRQSFEDHGLSPSTWMSPARNESYLTPDLLTENGFSTCLDWEMDQRPVALNTRSGKMTCLPNLNELNDFNLLLTKRQSESEWRDNILEAGRFISSEYDRFGSQCFGFTLTPYVSGLPFRIHALREILRGLKQIDGLEIRTAAQLTDDWRTNV